MKTLLVLKGRGGEGARERGRRWGGGGGGIVYSVIIILEEGAWKQPGKQTANAQTANAHLTPPALLCAFPAPHTQQRWRCQCTHNK